MTTTATAITTDQVTRLSVCFRTLGWPREQIITFLLTGWQVERITHLTGEGAEAAITALVDELAVWATPEEEPPTPDAAPPSDDPDWDTLASVDRPDAPALLAQRDHIEVLMTALQWHPQHRENHLIKHYNVSEIRNLTVAQAEAAILDLTARAELLPQGGVE